MEPHDRFSHHFIPICILVYVVFEGKEEERYQYQNINEKFSPLFLFLDPSVSLPSSHASYIDPPHSPLTPLTCHTLSCNVSLSEDFFLDTCTSALWEERETSVGKQQEEKEERRMRRMRRMKRKRR